MSPHNCILSKSAASGKPGAVHALADAEMTAHLWLRMTFDIADRFGYKSVPLALLEQLQSIAKHRAADYLHTYGSRSDRAASTPQ